MSTRKEKYITARVTPEILARIKQIAREWGVPDSTAARMLLKKALREFDAIEIPPAGSK